jgi:FtsP/CotA-like multicopper oxidase with cupredoxin domain
MGAQRGAAGDSLILQPGETKDAHFTATTPGTYYYAGQTVPGPLAARVEEDSQLNGAIVVDPAGASGRPIDRVFVISWWFTLDSTSRTGIGRGTMAINGLSWPHTERFDVAQGDSLHWRWINLTSLDHPMHLHGFYYRVDTKGDGARDTVYAPEAQRMVVTEIVDPGQTMRIAWAPTRAGNWIFHCHFAGHISPHLTAIDAERGELPSHDVLETSHPSDRPHHMSALILGIRVSPRGPAPVAPVDARAMRLEIRSKPNVYGDQPGFAFVLGGTPAEADPAAMPLPGPPLILERNQPVAINVVNRSEEQAAVHWHGIELESFPDGVPHWSGSQRSTLPTIPPGDSLTVRFTPPRAGTFMYHSHFNEFNQITSGLYGAIIVLEPGQRFDPETDRLLIFSERGPMVNVITGPFAPHTLNGQVRPDPMEFRAGTTYRLRLINIKSDIPSMVKLLDGTKPVLWRAVAKDGADLPESQRKMVPADLRFDPGEIYDFEFTPARAGRLKLEFGFPVIPPLAMTPVEVRIR